MLSAFQICISVPLTIFAKRYILNDKVATKGVLWKKVFLKFLPKLTGKHPCHFRPATLLRRKTNTGL